MGQMFGYVVFGTLLLLTARGHMTPTGFVSVMLLLTAIYFVLILSGSYR